jgi:hypothetical protein
MNCMSSEKFDNCDGVPAILLVLGVRILTPAIDPSEGAPPARGATFPHPPLTFPPLPPTPKELSVVSSPSSLWG